jgi:chromosome partitioning protein
VTATIISVCNQKGGCGKTTITMALAAAFSDGKSRVLVVDGDPQGSASTWSANAPEESPFPATVANLSRAGKSLPSEVRKMVKDYDVVLIDCPPSVDSPVPQAALLISDLALIPLIPSPADVAAAAPFIQLVEQAQLINTRLRALVVPNMVQKNTKIALGYLEHFAALPVPTTKVQLGLRTSHRQACALGTSVQQLGDREAVAEIRKLKSEMERVLKTSAALPEAASL